MATKPSSGTTAKQRSGVVKKAVAGKPVFGGTFDKVANKAAKEYGSKSAGEKVAAAAMWRKAAQRGK